MISPRLLIQIEWFLIPWIRLWVIFLNLPFFLISITNSSSDLIIFCKRSLENTLFPCGFDPYLPLCPSIWDIFIKWVNLALFFTRIGVQLTTASIRLVSGSTRAWKGERKRSGGMEGWGKGEEKKEERGREGEALLLTHTRACVWGEEEKNKRGRVPLLAFAPLCGGIFHHEEIKGRRRNHEGEIVRRGKNSGGRKKRKRARKREEEGRISSSRIRLNADTLEERREWEKHKRESAGEKGEKERERRVTLQEESRGEDRRRSSPRSSLVTEVISVVRREKKGRRGQEILEGEESGGGDDEEEGRRRSEEERGRGRRRREREGKRETRERLWKSGREKSKRMGDWGEEEVEEEMKTLLAMKKFKLRERDHVSAWEREIDPLFSLINFS